jgi:hypothetical protein
LCSLTYDRRSMVGLLNLGTPAASVSAQELEDVVRLRDGTNARGIILEELPGGSVLLQLSDGQRVRYASDEIERITRTVCLGGPPLIPGQAPDPSFEPEVRRPAYPPASGPRVLFDEFYSGRRLAGSHIGFAKVLEKDGYRLSPLRSSLTAESLHDADIFVTAGPTAGPNALGFWFPSVSAFSVEEIELLVHWIEAGGSLLLNVDHLPSAGGSIALARRLGILLNEGYATDQSCQADEFEFVAGDGSLSDHPITRGRDASERVERVRTITGTAFREVPGVAMAPLMTLAPGSMILMPTYAWDWRPPVPYFPGEGMFQGAALRVGEGRVAVFGEIAMFTAQVRGPVNNRMPMGMNMPTAPENVQFLLNVFHWLDGLLPER